MTWMWMSVQAALVSMVRRVQSPAWTRVCLSGRIAAHVRQGMRVDSVSTTSSVSTRRSARSWRAGSSRWWLEVATARLMWMSAPAPRVRTTLLALILRLLQQPGVGYRQLQAARAQRMSSQRRAQALRRRYRPRALGQPQVLRLAACRTTLEARAGHPTCWTR